MLPKIVFSAICVPPILYFIEALPYEAIQGNIRLTEQGETIAQKYENKVNAEYNLYSSNFDVFNATQRACLCRAKAKDKKKKHPTRAKS